MIRVLTGALALLIAFPGPGKAGEGSKTGVSGVIEGRVTWSGEVSVDGVIVVREGGELTVAPGTRVRFVPRDADGDGIGDSELRVEGALVVAGTRQEPVIFTSAAREPAAADWKYVMINHARRADVRYAVFEYAFSGVQIHYTRGTFDSIVSRHNVDGFRFSTAPVALRNSYLTGNGNGIRFEERGVGAVIENNVIETNRIGIFAVIRCTGLTRFAGNILENNSSYSIKLGDEQAQDLPVEGNWWGTADGAAIESTFFDGRVEPGMGKVLFRPFLDERPVPGEKMAELMERWSNR